MRFFGIDQSLTSSGFVLLSDLENKPELQGLITPKKLRGAARLSYIYDSICDILKAAPAVQGALEGYAFDAVHRGQDLGEVGGIVRLALHKSNCPFQIVAPAALKKFVTGNGGASKEGMALAVQKYYGQRIEQNDICDAYGLAQVARSFFLKTGTRRCELEVIRDLQVEKLPQTSLRTGKDI